MTTRRRLVNPRTSLVFLSKTGRPIRSCRWKTRTCSREGQDLGSKSPTLNMIVEGTKSPVTGTFLLVPPPTLPSETFRRHPCV